MVLNPCSWDTLAVTPPEVVDSSLANTTKKAVPPASAGLGSPARLGKLLQRNTVPPAFRSQPDSSRALTPEMMVLEEAVQWAPPSVESSSSMLKAPLQSSQATMASPLASNAGEVPLPQSGTMLMESALPVQLAPPLSL